MAISITSNTRFPSIIRWVKRLLITVFLILAAVILAYSYSERVVLFASQHITQDYGLKIERFKRFTVTTSPQLQFSVGQIDLSFDYAQFQRATQKTTTAADAEPPFNAAKILALIPQLHIAEMNLQWQNLPAEVDLPWSAVTVKDISYSRLPTPEIGFSVWHQQQPLLQVNAFYQQQIWQGQLITELVNLAPFISLVLPDNRLAMSGLVTANVQFAVANREQIALQLKLENAALVSADQPLAENVSLQLSSELKLTASGWLPIYINLNINQLSPLQLDVARCQQVRQLLQRDVMNCESLAKFEPIVITPALPVTVSLALQEGDPEKWQISSEQINAQVSSAQTQLEFGLTDLQASADSSQGTWTLALDSNTSQFTALNVPLQVHANGQFVAQPQTLALALTVAQAKLTAQDLQVDDLHSQDLTAELSAPLEIALTDSAISPFSFAFASNFANNQYQKYTIAQLQGTHSGEFTAELVTLTSNWQLDSLLLHSTDHMDISGSKLNTVSGHWQLPEQALPELLMQAYPLPVGLNLPATTTAELNYALALLTEKPQVTAQLSGSIAADSAKFNDISITGIATDWGCELQSQPKLSTNCQISTAVDAIDIGVPLTDINFSAQMKADSNKFSVSVGQASAQLFNGTLWVEPLLIKDFDHIVGQLRFKDLSLPKMLELYQLPGVTVTGLLQAQLPFVAQGKRLTVTDGVIEQQGAGGIIQIKDNATVEQLKLTQPQLKFALDLLADMDYHYLHSDVDFQPDGQAKLQISIKGRNPTVERPIEFNYSHDENVLQLFRSLRINDSMYNAIKKANNQ